MKKEPFLLIVFVILIIVGTKLFFLPSFSADGEIETNYYGFYPAFDVTTKIIELIILIGIARSGTIAKTIYFNIILFCIGVYIIGALFKIMHWPLSNVLLLVPLISIVITYIVRTINKKNKTTLDIFKVLWVVSIATESIMRLCHLVRQESLIFSDLIGWFLILFFVVEEYKKRLLKKGKDL